MSPSLRHVRHLPRQLPVVMSLVKTAVSKSAPSGEVTQRLAPIAPSLVRDFIAHVDGDPDRYRKVVPPHLFPQWGVPLASRTLRGLPYPVTRVVNAGCRLEINGALPAGKPLLARAQLLSIDDDGRRALLTTRVATGTDEQPDAVVATIRALVPRTKGNGKGSPKAEVPYDADEIARFSLAADAGLTFALLTGDFNPIHWVKRAGVAAGFGGTILHGFSMFARGIEGVVRGRLAGDPTRVRAWDARFTRPLRLPADVTLFSRGHEAWLGEVRGSVPFMTLSYDLRCPGGSDV